MSEKVLMLLSEHFLKSILWPLLLLIDLYKRNLDILTVTRIQVFLNYFICKHNLLIIFSSKSYPSYTLLPIRTAVVLIKLVVCKM